MPRKRDSKASSVARGRILDVVVDLRVSSPTFAQWVSVELSAENVKQVVVPVGFGHAFLALTDEADLEYRCSGYYTPSAEHAIIWNDPDIAIDWPIALPIVSPRDRAAMNLRQYLENPAFR